MPNPYQQKVRQRKLIYFVLVLVLFFVSLLHRKNLVEPSADDLYLRETTRGQTELGSSAISLLLSGSKGLATTIMWSIAQEQQKRHQYNELELTVASIAKLQPHFVTPWVFQGWNLAFNVAVEWDRPQDKYYYITRGVSLLADGERRHEGTSEKATDERKPRFPGNPDMRFQIGNFYMLKFGTSDEKYTMRSLMDVSTIPPERRDPERFYTTVNRVRSINTAELERFCRDYPRLVRRLREQVGYTTEKQIVNFLKESMEVPGRFEKYAGPWDQAETKLLADYRQQFPVLPSPQAASQAGVGEEGWPNPANRELTTQESLDSYLVARTWLLYAQRPLPPPVTLLRNIRYNPLEHRIPKQPGIFIFRNYPALAQIYVAETMQQEGWFDSEGWVISDWFERDQGDVRVGTSDIFNSQAAWTRAISMLFDFGGKNGLVLSDETLALLEERARRFAQKWNVRPGSKITIPASQQDEDYWAHEALQHSGTNRQTTNFDQNLSLADMNRDSQTILAKKYFYQGERLRRFEQAPEPALRLYEKAVPLYLESLLRHPAFNLINNDQEDTYEWELKYVRHVQRERAGLFRNLAMGMWQLGPWPQLPFHELLPQSEKTRIVPIRAVRGPFSSTMFYHGPAAETLKYALWRINLATTVQPLGSFPGHHQLFLTAKLPKGASPPPYWLPLVPPDTLDLVRQRLRLDK